MLTCNKLRIDPGEGSAIVEYRIENGRVESRTLRSNKGDETGWQRLAPQQISLHVMANTVVAQWLRGRMGIHRLLRACTADAGNPKIENTGWRDRSLVVAE
jgi:hypothetical protein